MLHRLPKCFALFTAVVAATPALLGQGVLTSGQTVYFSNTAGNTYSCTGSGIPLPTCYVGTAFYNINVPQGSTGLNLSVTVDPNQDGVAVYIISGASIPQTQSSGAPIGATYLGHANAGQPYQGSVLAGATSGLALTPGTWTICLYVTFEAIITVSTSGSITATVSGPASAAITGLNPSSTAAGGPEFTLIVNGTGFVSGAVVEWNGTALSTNYISPTQLTASVPGYLIANSGSASVTVLNPGATASAAASFTISSAPSLTITGLSPSSVIAGAATFALTVNGTGFVAGSVVQWNGTALSTTFVSATQLTASVPANLVSNPGSATVAVVNPSGTSSGTVSFAINEPSITTITSLSPSSASAGGPAFTLTINGSGFVSGNWVQWNSTTLTTTYVSPIQLTAAVPANLIANPGSASVSVGFFMQVVSNTVTFSITTTTQSLLAQVAAGAGWTTVISLFNMSASPVTATVNLHADDGSALSLPLTITAQGTSQTVTASSPNVTINANSTVQISMGSGLSNLSAGWANVASSGPIGGFAIFRTQSSNSPVSEGTVPLLTQAPTTLLVPYDNTAGAVTGVAIANGSSAAVSVTATIWDQNGTLLGTETIPLAAEGHTAFQLPTQYSITVGKMGVMQLQSGAAGLTAVGLRFSAFGTFTSVPVIVVK
jgi:hypothetical protein